MAETNYDPNATSTFDAARSEVQSRMNSLATNAEYYKEQLVQFLDNITGTRLTETSEFQTAMTDILNQLSELKLNLPEELKTQEITVQEANLPKAVFNPVTYNEFTGKSPEPPTDIANINPPTLDDLDEPVINVPDIPEMPNIFEEIATPKKPDTSMPDSPEFLDMQDVEAPDIQIPNLELEKIDYDNISVPNTNLFYNPREFELRFTERIEELLSGRHGLSEDTEDAIWARAKARNDLKNERMYKEAEEYFASRGFEMPTGAMNATLQDIRKEINRSEEQINYEIAAESSRIAHEFTRAYADALSRHEGILADIHNNEEQRYYDSIKSSMQYAIDVFNTQVQHIRAKAEFEQLKLQEFEGKIKAELSKLDVFRVQVEGARLKTEYNRGLVEKYTAAVDMVKAGVDLYNSEIEAVRNQVANNEQKVNAYRAKLDAVSKNAQAEMSKVDLYNAKISAQQNKVSLYNTKLQGKAIESQNYGNYISAYNSWNSLQIENVRARSDVNRNNAEGEMTRLSTDSQIARTEAEIESLRAKDKLSEREVNLSEYNSQVDAKRMEFEKMLSKMNVTKDISLANLESSLRELQIRSDELQSKTQATSQLVASAFNGINVSASIAASGSTNYSNSSSHQYDETKSTPTKIYQYNYTE